MSFLYGWAERKQFEKYLTRRLAEHRKEWGKQMKLSGHVIEVKSGSEYTDKHPRVTFRLSPGPGRSPAILILPDDEGWELDQEVEVSISMAQAEEVPQAVVKDLIDNDPTSTLKTWLERQAAKATKQ